MTIQSASLRLCVSASLRLCVSLVVLINVPSATLAAEAVGPASGIMAVDCPKGKYVGAGFIFDKPRVLQNGAFVTPSWTIRDAFGTGYPHPFGFEAGLDIGNATGIFWWGNGGSSNYWFASTASEGWSDNVWFLTGDQTYADQASVGWPWEEPFFIKQPTSAISDARVIFSGLVRPYAQSYIFPAGRIETCYRSDARHVTLASAGLYTGDPTTGVIGATISGAADIIILSDAAAILRYFYYDLEVNHWCEDTGDPAKPDAGAFPIAPLDIIYVVRRPGTPTLLLTFPAAF